MNFEQPEGIENIKGTIMNSLRNLSKKEIDSESVESSLSSLKNSIDSLIALGHLTKDTGISTDCDVSCFLEKVDSALEAERIGDEYENTPEGETRDNIRRSKMMNIVGFGSMLLDKIKS